MVAERLTRILACFEALMLGITCMLHSWDVDVDVDFIYPDLSQSRDMQCWPAITLQI